MKLREKLEEYGFDVAFVKPKKLGTCVIKSLSFHEFAQEIKSRLLRDTRYTAAQYLKLSTDDQLEAKDIGSYCPGYFRDGKRRADHLKSRSMITFDLDSMTPEQYDYFMSGKSRIWDYPFLAHSTRKHTEDKPRLRIVVPCEDKMTPEEYEAASRHLACHILETREESLDATDEVSYRPAQVAFWPSVSKDQKFILVINDDESGAIDLFDAQVFLRTEHPDWRDYATLPHSEKRGAAMVRKAKVAENPRKKKGIVGAFCRTYDVEDVIEKFLPDVYEPGDPHSNKPRYTYLQGTSSNGAVVEDDGLFLFSHHSSDPCGEQLVNAWDLYRVHKFHELDVDKDGEPITGVPTVKLPSHKAMEEFARNDRRVMAEMFKSEFDFEAVEADADRQPEGSKKERRLKEVDDLIGDDEPVKKKADVDWMTDLDVSPTGLIRDTLPNYSLIIQNDPRFGDAFAFDELGQRVKVMRSIKSKVGLFPERKVFAEKDGDPLNDFDYGIVRMTLEAQKGKGFVGYALAKIAMNDLVFAVESTAKTHAFHPIKRRIEAVKWDGVKRVERFMIDTFALEDNLYTREVSLLFFLAGIARVYHPGTKFDHVLTVEGAQGCGKSTVFRYLAFEDHFFGELNGNLSDRKKALEDTLGRWILEMAELSSLRKSEVEDLKAFISSTVDSARLAYDRERTDVRRQFIMVATTNEEVYLRDQSGNRRFLPVRTPLTKYNPVDLDFVREIAPQLWAEALVLYQEKRKKLGLRGNAHLRLTLSREAMMIADGEVAQRTVADSAVIMAEEIRQWIEKPVTLSALEDDGLLSGDVDDKVVLRCVVTVNQIMKDCFGMDLGRSGITSAKAQEIGSAMRMLGWENSRYTDKKMRFSENVNGKTLRNYAYIRPNATTGEIQTRYRVVSRRFNEVDSPV